MRLIILFLFIAQNSIAQNQNTVQWAWSNTYSNQSNSTANQIVVDDSNNIYVAGFYRDTLVMDSLTLYGPSLNDAIFVAKFNPNGVVLWARRIDWGNFVDDIMLDSQGNVRVLTSYRFLTTYNSNTGQLITSYSLPYTSGAGNDEFALEVQLDENDMMYVISQSGISTLYSTVYVRYYNTSNVSVSDTLWERQFEIGSNFFPFGGFVGGSDIDSAGNLYLGGVSDFYYQFELQGDSIVTSTSPTFTPQQIFIAKYDDTGSALWLDTIPNSSVDLMDLKLNSLDSSIYFTGYHYNTEIVHGDTMEIDTTNQFQILLTKYDLEGSYEWSKGFSLESPSVNIDPNSSDACSGTHLAITDSGYVYLKGIFNGSMIWNTDTLYEDTSVYFPNYIADDVFFAKLDTNGNVLWGKYAGNAGADGPSSGGFWVDDSTGTLYMVGYNIDTNGLNKSSNYIQGVFVAKEVGGPTSTVGILEVTHDSHSLLVYPNPMSTHFTVLKSGQEPIPFELRDAQGKLLQSGVLQNEHHQIDVSNYSGGMLFLITELGVLKLMKTP